MITKNSSKDDVYLDAVNRGDMETAQKMVEEAARLEGYDSPMLYHGTDKLGLGMNHSQGLYNSLLFVISSSVNP